MSRRGWLAAVVCVVVAGGTLWSPPAYANRQRGVVVTAGRVSTTSYPPLVGVVNDEYTGQIAELFSYQIASCEHEGPCDFIPLRLESLPHVAPGSDLLVRLTVTWDSSNGTNGLETYILDPAHESSDDLPVMVGPATHSGRISFGLPDPTLTRYDLVVASIGGVNRGYHLDASTEVVPHGDIAPTLRNSDATASDADASRVRPGRQPNRSGAPASARTVSIGASDPLGSDARLSAMRALSARARHGSRLGGLSWWSVALGVVVLGLGASLLVLRRREGGVMVGVVRRRFRDLRLFWKLLVPFIAALLVIGLAGAFLTTRYLASNANTNLNRTLLQRSVASDTYLRDAEVNLLEAQRFAANLQGVPEAAASRDTKALASALSSAVAVNKGLDVLAVTDPTGRGLVEFTAGPGGFSPHGGADFSASSAVHDVLAGVVDAAGDKHTGFVRLSDGSVWLLTAGPVRTDHLVGVALAGISLDRLATGAATASRAQVGLYDRGGMLLGVSSGPKMASSLAPRLTGSVPMRQREGQRAAAFAPLVIRGTQVGTVVTRVSRAPAFAAVRGAAIRIAALVALAMAAVIGFGALVSRYIVGNVEELLATNRALGAGDLSVRAPVRSGDELGELASGFNLMAEQLAASYAELERRVDERTEELSRLYAENVASSEARAQFFASISHEFRTPLFAILANVELLAEPALGPPEPGELAEGLSTIDASAKVLLDRVNEILELARAETTGVELELADVSVVELWSELAPTVTALARSAEVSLAADLAAGLPAVRADAARLRQILLNVVSNAIKYTPAGGSVRVAADHEADAVHLAVSDTGVGIPPSVGDKVFEPYYRVTGSRGRRGWASTGLGLALTKRLVDAHGGRIWFESSPAGTTFHVSIPTVGAKPKRKARAK